MVAFKEWQIVCEALAAGRQDVILRKGGIHEGREGFSWAHDEFLLFPTRFHSQREGVKARDWERFGAEGLEEWEEGDSVLVTHRCVIKKAVTLDQWEEVEALAKRHVWTEETVRERFDWEMKGMKGESLHAAFVETHELEKPLGLIYTKREHGGCRSWLELKEN